MSGDIYAAKESFSVEWDGHRLVVQTGSTIREGHPLLVKYPSLFKKLNPDFEHEPPKPPPAPKLPAAPPAPPAPKKVAVAAPPAKPPSASVPKKGDDDV